MNKVILSNKKTKKPSTSVGLDFGFIFTAGVSRDQTKRGARGCGKTWKRREDFRIHSLVGNFLDARLKSKRPSQVSVKAYGLSKDQETKLTMTEGQSNIATALILPSEPFFVVETNRG